MSNAIAAGVEVPFSVDSFTVQDGELILSGREGEASKLSFPVLQTALRIACTGQDPWFSLDPDEPAAWAAGAKTVGTKFWDKIASREGFSKRGLRRTKRNQYKVVHASGKYPDRLRKVLSQYPELKTRLVFKPDWLRHTKMGRILFEADVLLKEISTGVGSHSGKVPAPVTEIEGYVSSLGAAAADGMRAALKDVATDMSPSGARMWFELAPPIRTPMSDIERFRLRLPKLKKFDYNIDSFLLPKDKDRPARKRRLERSLKKWGLVRETETSDAPPPENEVYAWMQDRVTNVVGDEKSGAAIDLASVVPRMRVRIYDNATGRDELGFDEHSGPLANHVSSNFSAYAEKYEILRELSGVFRAYVIAVNAVKSTKSTICRSFPSNDLSPSEKLTQPLSTHRVSDFVFAAFKLPPKLKRDGIYYSGMHSMVSGGISLNSGRLNYVGGGGTLRRTDVNMALIDRIFPSVAEPYYRDGDGRHYLALSLKKNQWSDLEQDLGIIGELDLQKYTDKRKAAIIEVFKAKEAERARIRARELRAAEAKAAERARKRAQLERQIEARKRVRLAKLNRALTSEYGPLIPEADLVGLSEILAVYDDVLENGEEQDQARELESGISTSAAATSKNAVEEIPGALTQNLWKRLLAYNAGYTDNLIEILQKNGFHPRIQFLFSSSRYAVSMAPPPGARDDRGPASATAIFYEDLKQKALVDLLEALRERGVSIDDVVLVAQEASSSIAIHAAGAMGLKSLYLVNATRWPLRSKIVDGDWKFVSRIERAK